MGLERKAVLRAAPAHAVHYERRRPEQTVLHCLVREHLETFLAQVEARTGTGLPGFVKDEFDAFLECGILAHGFLRVRCADTVWCSMGLIGTLRANRFSRPRALPAAMS